MKYDAKSSSWKGEPVSCKEHLSSVASLAGKYGAKFGMENEAYLAGLLHDFGKYSDTFQEVLYKGRTGIDHALPGAVLAGGLPDEIVESVAAHHSALLSKYELKPYFRPGTGSPSGKCPSLCTKEDYVNAKRIFMEDFGEEVVLGAISDVSAKSRFGRTESEKTHSGIEAMMRSRMLLSCLVDADWSVSAYEEDGDESNILEGRQLDATRSLRNLERLHDEVSNLVSGGIRALRETVWEQCGRAGRRRGRYFELSAPTGSGKTFGFFRFALERCKTDHTRKRVVIALPFLSLTDQVYDVANKVVDGAILDTSTAASNVSEMEKNRDACSRWDAPCIVTTTVQLFGSLFSDHPGDLRKLHRLSDAVIVLDEVQALPDRLKSVCFSALEYLVRETGAVVLLSTATMPKLGGQKSACRVVEDSARLFQIAEAEGIELMEGERTPAEISVIAALDKQSLVVCNTKRRANEAYNSFLENGADNAFLLTTGLCPDNRREIVSKVKSLLLEGEPVHVAATQCIEAGVDLDFLQVYRELAPLPSLIQTAGRQNRERKRPRGAMKVFVPSRSDGGERLYPDSSYEKGASVSLSLFLDGFDLSSQEALCEYFRILFSKDPTPEKLKDAVRAKNYAGFAKEAKLIEDKGVQIIVPYNEELWREALNAALSGRESKRKVRGIISRCQGTSVGVYRSVGLSSCCAELSYFNPRLKERIGTGYFVLLKEFEDCYSEETGFLLENAGRALFC